MVYTENMATTNIKYIEKELKTLIKKDDKRSKPFVTEIIRINNYLITEIRDLHKYFNGGNNETYFDDVYTTAVTLAIYGVKKNRLNLYRHFVPIMLAAAYHNTGMIISNTKALKYSDAIMLNDFRLKSLYNITDADIIAATNAIHYYKECDYNRNIITAILTDSINAALYCSENKVKRIMKMVVDIYHNALSMKQMEEKILHEIKESDRPFELYCDYSNKFIYNQNKETEIDRLELRKEISLYIYHTITKLD